MQFLNDYKNHGGRVTLGSDSGYIWKVYTVLAIYGKWNCCRKRASTRWRCCEGATIHGAEVLEMSDRIGSIRVGKLADLVVTEQNPLRNFKVLYGTGHFRLGDDNQP